MRKSKPIAGGLSLDAHWNWSSCPGLINASKWFGEHPDPERSRRSRRNSARTIPRPDYEFASSIFAKSHGRLAQDSPLHGEFAPRSLMLIAKFVARRAVRCESRLPNTRCRSEYASALIFFVASRQPYRGCRQQELVLRAKTQ